ncbi:MAG: hypothetical protein M3433_02255 [Actinomycetota bacterium]|nr:hypothetical protein [Actinomycetota bacterium]
MSVLNLRALLDALEGHGVRFVLIGGVAVAAHGYVRATEGLDLVPDPERENIRHLVDALLGLRAVVPGAGDRPFGAPEQQALARGKSLSLTTDHGAIDVIQAAHGVPDFNHLAQDAVATELLGVPVLVCSLTRLRAMKEAVGRTQDRADLERLPPL